MKKSFLLFISVLILAGCTKHFIKPTVICMDNQDFIQSSNNHPKGETLQNILDSWYGRLSDLHQYLHKKL